MKHNKCATCKLCYDEFHEVCIGLCRNGIPNIDLVIWSCMWYNENLFPDNYLMDEDEFVGVNNNNQKDI